MKVRRPSGSKIGRALACAASCWLEEGEQGAPHPSAARGTRIHGALERSYLTAREADIYHGLRPDEVELARKAIASRPHLSPAFIHWPMIEVECWYNPLTCEAVFGSTPDDPPHGWWRGRGDYMGRSPSRVLKAGDHKTGSPRHQTPPAKSAQLGFFGNWLANHPDSAAEVKTNGLQLEVYTTQDGSIHAVHQSLNDLAPQAEAMAALEAKLQIVEAGGPEADKVIAENPPVINRECFWCPCRATCPAQQEKKNAKKD